MLKTMLACCKLYISESRNAIALESIERAAKVHPEAKITNIFKDEVYNRVGYTIVSHVNPASSSLNTSSPLKKAVFSMVKAALEAIDLELHSGTHPRVGVVDHICFHPLAQASLDQAAGLAKSVAADIGHNLKVPTFVYGAAHERGKTLDAIRRELGYFKPSSKDNLWTGGLPADALLSKPDHGPAELTGNKGVVIVGATHWVDNYNVPVLTTNIEAVKRIARRVSERGGGLQSVQAMGLLHGDNSTEVACNLLDPSRVGAHQVQLEIQKLALEEGLGVAEGYFTDFSQEKVIEMYLRNIGSN
ncbi:Glutamate formimidoyltransferase protein [Dioscorea alata]|uniref:Glutamate formimidoyltransferase protein n=1 Tax=Dioscorea alata TaxID=55571 RepID=A0ACB7UNZ7_DIOAL|nr:Glutamate formimidoyltransferase protein [Dioscorea alata]